MVVSFVSTRSNHALTMTTSSDAISVSYTIAVPSTYEKAALPSTGTVSIPVASGKLVDALEQARDEMNRVLTQWKDEIGEMEKPKEVKAVQLAAERKKLARESMGGDLDDADDGSEEED